MLTLASTLVPRRAAGAPRNVLAALECEAVAVALEGCSLRLASGATERGLAAALVLLEFNFFAPEGAQGRETQFVVRSVVQCIFHINFRLGTSWQAGRYARFPGCLGHGMTGWQRGRGSPEKCGMVRPGKRSQTMVLTWGFLHRLCRYTMLYMR